MISCSWFYEASLDYFRHEKPVPPVVEADLADEESCQDTVPHNGTHADFAGWPTQIKRPAQSEELTVYISHLCRAEIVNSDCVVQLQFTTQRRHVNSFVLP